MKEADFGLVRQHGQLVAKVLDLDSGWLGDQNAGVKFQLLTNNNTCATDGDCNSSIVLFVVTLLLIPVLVGWQLITSIAPWMGPSMIMRCLPTKVVCVCELKVFLCEQAYYAEVIKHR